MSQPIRPRAFVALLLGNVALAFGPWIVRLSGVGPATAGVWRLLLAVPFLWLIAVATKQRPHWPGAALAGAIALAAFFFAADLAAWHAGIGLTKLGNATLFGNVASFAFAGWGLWIARSWPTRLQAAALVLALVGTVLLMVKSAELSAGNLHGDLLSLLAGLLYTGYLIGVERIRGTLQPLPLLILASLFGAAYLLPLALMTGERLVPADWTWVLLLALGSQVIGQGLLVYALGEVPPLVVGLTLLTQPAVSALIGWIVYRERLTLLDFVGAGAIAVALVLVRLRPRAAGST
ncbi:MULTISPECIES: DMT family transporter [Sphingomonas]|uniref:DMT family transporter n=1 Tax=Sphingomonas TaxID=13687 RepID=UPI000DEF1139|nr:MULTISPECIES: DMT family transporter [Sphingomonas]